MKYVIVLAFCGVLAAQKPINLFADSTAQHLLKVENKINADGKAFMQLNFNAKKKIVVSPNYRPALLDSAELELISAKNATFQDMNWVRKHHDELNNVHFTGINPIGAVVLILKAMGLVDEKKTGAITINVESGHQQVD